MLLVDALTDAPCRYRPVRAVWVIALLRRAKRAVVAGAEGTAIEKLAVEKNREPRRHSSARLRTTCTT